MAELYYIQVIRKCNQNCRFCSNPSNEKAITAAAARKLIDKYARLNAAGIIFTGGEPTLYQGLAGLIKYTAGKNIEPRITTNCQKISDMSYLQSLRDAGLSHIHCSLYSHEARTHEYLTRTPGSYGKLTRALYNAWKLGIRTDINTVINRFNSRKLHLLAEFIIDNFPFVRHFVFNNMDPGMDRAVEDTSTVPVMSEFEASLAKAMRLITESGRTFRVERVPLCFMAEFQHCATETRKIVKAEDRKTYFLDEKKLVTQTSWEHGKSDRCRICGLKEICAGLYKMDVYYSSAELCPVFADAEAIKKRILDGR